MASPRPRPARSSRSAAGAAAAAASSGAISAWARASGPASARAAPAAPPTIAPPASRKLPSQNRSSARSAPAPRGSPGAGRCAAGGASVGRQVAQVRRRALAGQRVQGRPAEPRRARDEEHLLGREQDGPQEPDEGGRAAADAVDPDPLAAAGRRRPGSGRPRSCPGRDRRRDRRSRAGRRPRSGRGPSPQRTSSRVGRRPVRAAPGEQDDRLEQARLAGGVRPPDELRPGPERGLERRVAAQVARG